MWWSGEPDLQSRLLENTATVEREESDVTRAGSQAALLAVYTIWIGVIHLSMFIIIILQKRCSNPVIRGKRQWQCIVWDWPHVCWNPRRRGTQWWPDICPRWAEWPPPGRWGAWPGSSGPANCTKCKLKQGSDSLLCKINLIWFWRILYIWRENWVRNSQEWKPLF